MIIDLNCDLGEGSSHDVELLDLVTSANICCGMHAGDSHTSLITIRNASQRGVRIGAHPGYADREHFGRREMALSNDEVFATVTMQVAGLIAMAESIGASVAYVKPHGALYNQACRDEHFAYPLMAAVCQFSDRILALPGSVLERVAGQMTIREGFADRRYQTDGSLVPRDKSNAFVDDADEAVEQAERLIREQEIRSLCVHGDNPQAVEFVRKLRDQLTVRGHQIRPFA